MRLCVLVVINKCVCVFCVLCEVSGCVVLLLCVCYWCPRVGAMGLKFGKEKGFHPVGGFCKWLGHVPPFLRVGGPKIVLVSTQSKSLFWNHYSSKRQFLIDPLFGIFYSQCIKCTDSQESLKSKFAKLCTDGMDTKQSRSVLSLLTNNCSSDCSRRLCDTVPSSAELL